MRRETDEFPAERGFREIGFRGPLRATRTYRLLVFARTGGRGEEEKVKRKSTV